MALSPEFRRSTDRYSSLANAMGALYEVPAGAMRLEYALQVPLLSSVDEYEALPSASPTPLDPSGIYVNGSNERIYTPLAEPVTYWDYGILMARSKAARVAELDDTVPYGALNMELEAQSINRCKHNNEAFLRLQRAMRQAQESGGIPDAVLEIVLLARSGRADLNQMLDLIKRFPEMISIETSNYQRYFDPEALTAAVRQARINTASLGRTFQDARLEMNPEVGDATDSRQVQGVKVQKTVLGRLQSSTSDTQHVLKAVYIPREGGRYEPCAILTYFRTTDYKTRKGYAHELIDDLPPRGGSVYAGDKGEITAPTHETAEVAGQLSEPDRRSYLRTLAAAARRMTLETKEAE